MVVPLAVNFPANSLVGSSWVYSDIPLGEMERWGPWLESITAHTMTQGATAGHQWKVVFYWSPDGRNWSNAIDLFASIAAGSGGAIQTPYSTTGNFGLHIRFAIAARGAGTIVDSATVSAWLALKFLCC